ncbi:MAG TPA: hypothetical protein PKD09_20730 [Aggregatilinea sp.]|uniref:hypothetical protein n=1 Tax=Aggregatilinea sp. TaxID=2806333 RepID=UPI002CD9D2D8|nr:hypothetical protein [Aggregatilinea sp.]HML24094.1 hypothetical protein [Aggregatilinea sp.]
MSADFDAIFDRLKALLTRHAPDLVVVHDAPGNYYLDTTVKGPNKKPLFFGAVQIKKNYVSYHLMPIYMYPDLLDGHSEELKKRMQGKSCFNFKNVDEPLLAELSTLTEQAYDWLAREHLSGR